MRHDVVKRRDIFEAQLNAGAPEARPDAAKDRYNLALALRIVRRLETSAGRGAVFEEIKKKNWLYRLVDTIYAHAGTRVLQPLALFAYMLKCVLSVGPFDADGAEAVSISQFNNEHHAIGRVAALVPDARLLRLSLKRGHLVGRGQVKAVLRLLVAAPRIWPLLSRLAHLYSFMPAARIASTLAFYIRFVKLFADRPRLTAAIVASNYSPEAIGLAAAAHRTGRRVVYVNHAPVAANAALVPPVLAECAIFYGDAVRQIYDQRSRCLAEVALIGQPWASRPMQFSDEVRTVGIFLTSLTKADAVSELVSAISATMPCAKIIIRNHPVALIKSDFSDLVATYENLQVTIGNPLDREIAACDLIICGNSGVAMNAVSGGRPVAYMDSLDGGKFDYIGLVASGLICHVEGWGPNLYRQLQKFYARPEWRSVMRSYDAGYEADVAALNRAARAIIVRHLRPLPGSCASSPQPS